MKVVVAMDSFKDSMTAISASRAVRHGLLTACPSLSVQLAPMADGGEGTADTILRARGGERVPCRVTGPLPEMRVDAGFVWLPAQPVEPHRAPSAGPLPGPAGPPPSQQLPGSPPWSHPVALVEMASASGLELLNRDQLDPLRATTSGTGELIAAAAEYGAERLWLAAGGSATVDGGVGAATALGWRFLDSRGDPVGSGGGALERIVEIRPPAHGPSGTYRSVPDVRVLCDVDNPLLGSRGAARVFGPQKGATPEQVERLEAGLSNLADLIEGALGIDVRDACGAGAAGGLGAGAVAFLGAELVSGVETVMEAVGLAAILDGSDWVITGEGRFDSQSLSGKVVSGIASRARHAGVRVGVIAGSVDVTPEEAARHGIDDLERASPAQATAEDLVRRAPELLAEAAARFARRRLCATSA